MEYLNAYKVIPRKGNIVRLYEFRGYFQYLADPAENEGNLLKRNPTAKLISVGVFAESLYDAVIHLHLLRPQYVPTRVSEREEAKVEIPRMQFNTLPESEDKS
jgi:hypothetical protein